MLRVLNHPTKLPARYAKAIGDVASRWTILEVHLLTLIWHAMGLDLRKGRVLTYAMNAESKLRLLAALPLEWISSPTDKAEVTAIHQLADSLRAKRNDFVHGFWGTDPSTPKKYELFTLKKTEHKILPRAKHYTAAEVQAVAMEISALTKRVRKLLKKLGATPP